LCPASRSHDPAQTLDGILARGCDRCWPHPEEKPIWQKDFFDRQLRSSESYREKWFYELENPTKAKLVARWEDWPFQGELNVLQWHEPA